MTAAAGWIAAKDLIVAVSGWPRQGLHIGAGLILFLAAAGLLRTHLGSVRAWLVVLGVAWVNEAVDLMNAGHPIGAADYLESWRDTLDTMMLPTLMLLWSLLLTDLVHGYRRSGRTNPMRKGRGRSPAPLFYQPANTARIASRST